MTFHASKGLEFDAVILPDIVEGKVPKIASLREVNEDEKRRLLYVAMTRARERLYVFTIKSEGNNSVLPSRFLKPLL